MDSGDNYCFYSYDCRMLTEKVKNIHIFGVKIIGKKYRWVGRDRRTATGFFCKPINMKLRKMLSLGKKFRRLLENYGSVEIFSDFLPYIAGVKS